MHLLDILVCTPLETDNSIAVNANMNDVLVYFDSEAHPESVSVSICNCIYGFVSVVLSVSLPL